MKSNPRDIQISYIINAISIDSFSLEPTKEIVSKLRKGQDDNLKLAYDVSGGIGIEADLKILQSIINVEVKGFDVLDEKTEHEICKISCSIDFRFDSLEPFVKSDKYVIPNRLWLTLSSVSYGTVRGILFEKLQGTKVGPLIMPVLNLTKMPREDLTYNLSNVEVSKP